MLCVKTAPRSMSKCNLQVAALTARLKHFVLTLPMWVSLLLSVQILTLVGMLASGYSINRVMEAYLIRKIDYNLEHSVKTWAIPSRWPSGPVTGLIQLPLYVRAEDSKGNLLNEGTPVDSFSSPDITEMHAKAVSVPITIGQSRPKGEQWRVIKVRDRAGTVYVASSLRSVQQIISELWATELWVVLGVIVFSTGFGWWIIRRNIRPLSKVEQLADKIAHGDMSIRIPDLPINTEVGKLTHSLNVMLSRIQDSFNQKEQSEAEAHNSESRLRRFLADASHELRTPLTSIRGFSELYQQGATRDVEWVLSRIEMESLRMSSIVEDLFFLARGNTINPVEHVQVDMLEVAKDTVIAAKATDTSRKININCNAMDEPPVVLGDKKQLTQIVGNYLTNALNHTYPGTPIDVNLTINDNEVVLEVVDRGPGLTEIDRQRVFERFYRTDSSRARQSGGSGLGLSIVAAFAASHGADVGVDSQLGQGSTFWLKLPRYCYGD